MEHPTFLPRSLSPSEPRFSSTLISSRRNVLAKIAAEPGTGRRKEEDIFPGSTYHHPPSAERLTTKECFQTKQFDLLLSLNQVGGNERWGAWPRPVHLALAQPDGINGVAADLQDQSSVHDVEQLAGKQLLLLIGDVLRTRELDLLQADGTEELLLVRHGTQVPIEEPAALGVAHGHGLPVLLPTVLKLDVQVSHCKARQDSESPALLPAHP